VHLVGFVFIVVIADARNHEPEIHHQLLRSNMVVGQKIDEAVAMVMYSVVPSKNETRFSLTFSK
jgi:hypothetical protein